MKLTTPLLLASLLLALAGPARAGAARDIASTAAADGRFTTLVAALERAGLTATLRGEGPFTVFAPTDEAFAALPPGALAGLLRSENRDALRRLLLQHVAAGRIRSQDLLPVSEAPTLAGGHLRLGLRVGPANVVEADVACSNGVIHVIDRVLLSALEPATRPGTKAQAAVMDVEATITAAIDRGVPLFNDGHVAECARIYHEAAATLVDRAGRALTEMDRLDLQAVLAQPGQDARERAWNLRYAFDRILMNAAFEPVREAEMPAGFPAPGPVGRVVVKRYPRYRAARAEGGNSFWTLFRHIKKNDVAMTAPVEMTMDAGMRMTDMAFLYGSPTQGRAGAHGEVHVLDLEPVEVLSVGVRGRRNETLLARARQALATHMETEGWKAAGAWRVLGYNSPMVPAAKQYWELQVPVTR